MGLWVAFVVVILATGSAGAQTAPAEAGRGLHRLENRAIPDNDAILKELARIGAMKPGPKKVEEVAKLAHVATEGRFTVAFLQHPVDVLSEALEETPMPDVKGEPNPAYVELAEFVRYVGCLTTLSAPQLDAAYKVLDARNEALGHADFTLPNSDHKKVSLASFKGKIVLVNFRDEDCIYCRQELAYLNRIQQSFANKIQVVAVTNASMTAVSKGLARNEIQFPVLFDDDAKAYGEFHVKEQPRTFVFDTSGKLVAQSIGMRTGQQFLNMLAKAGLTQ